MKVSTKHLAYAALVRKRGMKVARHRFVVAPFETETRDLPSSAGVPVIEFVEPGEGKVTALGWNGRLYLPAEEPGRWLGDVRPCGTLVDEGDPSIEIISHEKERALDHARHAVVLFGGRAYAACPQPRVVVAPDTRVGRQGEPARVSMDRQTPSTSTVGLDAERARRSLRLVARDEREYVAPRFRVLERDLLWDTGECDDLATVSRLVTERMAKTSHNVEEGCLRAMLEADVARMRHERDLYPDHASWHAHGTAMRAALLSCLAYAELPKPLLAAAEFATSDCPGLDAPPPVPAFVVPEEDDTVLSGMTP